MIKDMILQILRLFELCEECNGKGVIRYRGTTAGVPTTGEKLCTFCNGRGFNLR